MNLKIGQFTKSQTKKKKEVRMEKTRKKIYGTGL